MFRITMTDAVTWILRDRKAPENERALYNDARKGLEDIYARCLAVWPTQGIRRKSNHNAKEVLRSWPPSLVIEVLEPIDPSWPRQLAELLDAARSLLWLETRFADFQRELQHLIGAARNREIDLYGRRSPGTRHVRLSPDDLTGPYELDREFRHLIPDQVARASMHSLGAAKVGAAMLYDVEVPEFQIAYIMGEVSDFEAYRLAKIKDWYANKHIPEYVTRSERPSRQQSKAAAVELFGDVPNLDTILKDCRRDLAPPSWHQGGRPPGKSKLKK